MATVVVGYVPKPEGEAALDRAIEEAQLRDAELIVVHSHRSRNGDGGGDDEPIPELTPSGPGSTRRGCPTTCASWCAASRPPRTW